MRSCGFLAAEILTNLLRQIAGNDSLVGEPDCKYETTSTITAFSRGRGKSHPSRGRSRQTLDEILNQITCPYASCIVTYGSPRIESFNSRYYYRTQFAVLYTLGFCRGMSSTYINFKSFTNRLISSSSLFIAQLQLLRFCLA